MRRGSRRLQSGQKAAPDGAYLEAGKGVVCIEVKYEYSKAEQLTEAKVHTTTNKTNILKRLSVILWGDRSVAKPREGESDPRLSSLSHLSTNDCTRIAGEEGAGEADNAVRRSCYYRGSSDSKITRVNSVSRCHPASAICLSLHRHRTLGSACGVRTKQGKTQSKTTYND